MLTKGVVIPKITWPLFFGENLREWTMNMDTRMHHVLNLGKVFLAATYFDFDSHSLLENWKVSQLYGFKLIHSSSILWKNDSMFFENI